jgi:hypothetical protein
LRHFELKNSSSLDICPIDNTGGFMRLFLGFVLTFVHALSYAQNAPTGVVQQTQPVTTQPSAPITVNAAPSTNQSARQSQGQNKSSGGAASAIGAAMLAAGAAMMAACAPSMCSCCPAAAQLIAMGLQGLAQGKANKGAAGDHGGQAGMSVAAVDPYGATYDVKSPDLSKPTDFSGDKDVLRKLADLKQFGVGFDPKKNEITLPNGKSINVADATNPVALANAGVSAAEFKKAMDLANATAKKIETEKIGASTATNGFESGGSGSAATTASPIDSEISNLAAGGVAAKIARDPAFSVAGMSKNYNGDNIGVSGDDIFSMMARKYREKHNKEAFLPPDSRPASAIKPF